MNIHSAGASLRGETPRGDAPEGQGGCRGRRGLGGAEALVPRIAERGGWVGSRPLARVEETPPRPKRQLQTFLPCSSFPMLSFHLGCSASSWRVIWDSRPRLYRPGRTRPGFLLPRPPPRSSWPPRVARSFSLSVILLSGVFFFVFPRCGLCHRESSCDTNSWRG